MTWRRVCTCNSAVSLRRRQDRARHTARLRRESLRCTLQPPGAVFLGDAQHGEACHLQPCQRVSRRCYSIQRHPRARGTVLLEAVAIDQRVAHEDPVGYDGMRIVCLASGLQAGTTSCARWLAEAAQLLTELCVLYSAGSEAPPSLFPLPSSMLPAPLLSAFHHLPPCGHRASVKSRRLRRYTGHGPSCEHGARAVSSFTAGCHQRALRRLRALRQLHRRFDCRT
jgi:hypothetical protein